MKVVFFALCGCLAAAISTSADADSVQRIGSWLVRISKDPFSTKAKTIALLEAPDNEVALAIRCMGDNGLSVVAMVASRQEYGNGERVDFKYRADEGPIAEDKGTAYGGKMIELPNARTVLADALKADTLYLRIATPEESLRDAAFKVRGAKNALAGVLRDCPDTAASSTTDDTAKDAPKPSR